MPPTGPEEAADDVVAQTAATVSRVRPMREQIADKRTIMILIVLCPWPARFNEIRRRVGGIAGKALADALKRPEHDGLVTRKVLPIQPVGVGYTITPLGRALREPFETLILRAAVIAATFRSRLHPLGSGVAR
jgi:DNA-binding HxlR family transcriptional regulator